LGVRRIGRGPVPRLKRRPTNSVPTKDDDPFDHKSEENVNDDSKEGCNPNPEVLQTNSLEVVTLDPAPCSTQFI